MGDSQRLTKPGGQIADNVRDAGIWVGPLFHSQTANIPDIVFKGCFHWFSTIYELRALATALEAWLNTNGLPPMVKDPEDTVVRERRSREAPPYSDLWRIPDSLMAGTFFAFSAFVMKALGRLPGGQGIEAMQSINIVVINPVSSAFF